MLAVKEAKSPINNTSDYRGVECVTYLHGVTDYQHHDCSNDVHPIHIDTMTGGVETEVRVNLEFMY